MFSIILYAALNIDDKNTLLRELSPVAAKWDDLGLALDLSVGTLEIIRKDTQYGYNTRLSATVSAWLRGEGGERSWMFLCAALRSPLVERPVLADQLERKYSVS